MYLREYDFECAVSMGKDERGQNDPTYRQRAVTLLREYQRALLHLKTGDKLEFGSYFLSNGVKPIKTFVRSPIVWQVLDKTDNRLLLLSEHSLDWELFGDVGACSWEASYLRKWLNSDCLRDWFAEEERALMQTKICPPEKNELSDVSDTESTEDWLFLLSFGEALQYFNGKGPGKGWKSVKRHLFERYTSHYPISHPAATAVIPLAEQSYIDKKVTEISYEPKEWWLRTPGVSEECRMVVCADGSVNVEGMKVGCDEVGVRPAMWLNPGGLNTFIQAFETNQEKRNGH